VHHKNSRHNSVMDRVIAACQRHSDYISSSGLAFDAVPQPEDTKFTKEEFEITQASQFEMELFTECFYYVAGRLRTLLQKSKPIPGLESFDCPGARDVRNQLLEHVEGKNSQVFIQSFAFGKENGPVLKGMRYAHQEHIFPDKGLYLNATEIKDNLEDILKRLLDDSA
jgi:hypothetical protein